MMAAITFFYRTHLHRIALLYEIQTLKHTAQQLDDVLSVYYRYYGGFFFKKQKYHLFYCFLDSIFPRIIYDSMLKEHRTFRKKINVVSLLVIVKCTFLKPY